MRSMYNQSLGVFETRFFPSLAIILLIGFFAALCVYQAFDHHFESAYYILVVAVAVWLIFVYLLISGYLRLIIYRDRLVLQQIFLSVSDEILFSEVETAKIKNTVAYASDFPDLITDHRNSTLYFLMKNGQSLEVSLSDYSDRSGILSALRQSNLWSADNSTC